MATRYYITDKPFTPSKRNTDHVYKVVELAGAAGCTWADIAAQMPAGVAQSGVHSYLYTLRKEGLIRSEETSTGPVKEENVSERLMRVRLFKWRCPSCGTWVREEIARQCRLCKEKRDDGSSPDRGAEEVQS